MQDTINQSAARDAGQLYIMIRNQFVGRVSGFSGTLDELTKIANAGNTAVFYVDSEAAARVSTGEYDDDVDVPEWPLGAGWYFSLGDSNRKAASQREAVEAVLGDDATLHSMTAEKALELSKGFYKGFNPAFNSGKVVGAIEAELRFHGLVTETVEEEEAELT